MLFENLRWLGIGHGCFLCGFVNFNLFHVIKFKLNLPGGGTGCAMAKSVFAGFIYDGENIVSVFVLIEIHNENCN